MEALCCGLSEGGSDMKYRLVRSGRKTIALQVDRDGQIVVRAPFRCSLAQIEDVVRKHEAWIRKQLQKKAGEAGRRVEITEQMRREGLKKARMIFPERTAYFASRMGVSYNRITIREQKTRWGSCSSKGNLNFNWKLVLLPEALLDYVVVHELAHRLEMNHSDRFWRVVEGQLPDYRSRRQLLRDVGGKYI